MEFFRKASINKRNPAQYRKLVAPKMSTIKNQTLDGLLRRRRVKQKNPFQNPQRKKQFSKQKLGKQELCAIIFIRIIVLNRKET